MLKHPTAMVPHGLCDEAQDLPLLISSTSVFM